ncbi:MAG: hypothetical protein ACLF0G_13650 [Candidatus Brocadiia bacterium]
MTEQQFHDQVDLYVAGELDASARKAFEQFLHDHPHLGDDVEAARGRIEALEGTLASYRASEAFVQRTMARVRAEAARMAPPEERPESLPIRLLRYAAMAAAAVLLVAGGYGLLRRPPLGRFAEGQAARVGLDPQPLTPGSPLARGDIVATPQDSEKLTFFSLAGGRLRAALAPGSRLRICDPRRGAVARLDKGDLFWRVRSTRGAPIIESPLAKVAAANAAVSIHVAPSGEGDERGFRGMVALAAHEGAARVIVPGRRRGALILRPGQVLRLYRGGGESGSQPGSVEARSERLRQDLQQIEEHYARLRSQWRAISEAVRWAPAAAHPECFARAVDLQRKMRRVLALRAERMRRLDLLQGCYEQGQDFFRSGVKHLVEEER